MIVPALDNWPLPASMQRFDAGSVSNPIELTIRLTSGLPLARIDSPYHDVRIHKQGHQHTIRFTEQQVNMDRDFVLNWQAAESSVPQAAIFSEEVDGEYYSLLMILPPHQKYREYTLNRDIVFIVDISGSMQGASIRQAKAGLTKALAKLAPEDRFNIIAFNNSYRTIFPALSEATQSNIQLAIGWVNTLDADSGTNMLPALNAALTQYHDNESLQQTVFITDGAVTNESQLFEAIDRNLTDSRLFTVGIGSAPNSFFMRKAAQFGRGSFTHIGDITQVTKNIDTLFNKLDSAVVKNLTAEWPGDGEIYPDKIPDLYFSEPLLISVKSKDLKGEVHISGVTARQHWQQYISLENHSDHAGAATLWARAKIEALEDLKISGGNRDAIKEEVIQVALRHKLLSAHTSFVAVEKIPARPDNAALRLSPLQNALPMGHGNSQHLNAVPFPQTATTAEITWWLGLLCVMLLIILRRLMKD